jgi:CelD/BcsL family acetyltransferase involved in cellulose biosynthesis
MALLMHAYYDPNGFEVLAEEWNGLLHRSAADILFLTLEYQRTWWRHLGEGEVSILAVRDGGELIGIAPLFVTPDPQGQRTLSIIGCVEVADYLDFIVAKGREEEVYAALVDYLASPSAPAWDVLDLCNIHQDSPTLKILPVLAQARGWAVSTARDDVCPIVTLPGTWEEYLQMLDGKQRHEIRRKMRRAGGQAALRWYIVSREHDLEAEVEDFLDLMAASTPDKAAFLTPRMRNFFRELARVAYDAGWLQLVFLEIDGRKAAAYLNFVYDNRVLVYNSGLDWQAFPKIGAGIILTAYCIRHAIEQGREVFDFMQGDERYKYQFGGQDIEVRRLDLRRS